jgi:hypothetical protein
VPSPFTQAGLEGKMTGTTLNKMSSAHSPIGEQHQVYLALGKHVAMRL